jgi:hypothetical protein
VWAIDLDSELKPVVSWKTMAGRWWAPWPSHPMGTLFAAIGAGRAGGNGRANAIVAARSEDTAAEGLVHTGCSRVRDRANHPPHGDKDIVAAATKDGPHSPARS